MSRILVVEDEETLAHALASVLEDEGFEAAIAPDGEVALQKIAQWRPDLVLLDLMMPVVDGFGVLDALEKAPSDGRPIVVVTTAASPHVIDRRRCAELLIKPFRLEKLLDAVKRGLGDGERKAGP